MAELTRRRFLKTTSLVAASGTLAACSVKSPAEQIPPLDTQSLDPQDLTIQENIGTPVSEIVPVSPKGLPDLTTIVLERLSFGGRADERESFIQLGVNDDARLNAWLDEQLHPEKIDDTSFEARFEKAGFETLNKSLEELVEDHIVNNPYKDNDDRHWHWFRLPCSEVIEAAFLRATYSRKQLQELLADFWHNHFSVNGRDDEFSPAFPSFDRDVIRKNLFGNFREMLEAMASHPSMLFYLNNRSNSDAGPNENFARELFELHTLGAENYLGVSDPTRVEKNSDGVAVGYVDNDVYEAARCFTGWRVDDDIYEWEDEVGKTGKFLYYRPWHDRFNKLIMGKYLPADQPDLKDGRDVLDMLARHAGTATFIARKLCRRFISDNPPESIVKAAAKTFLENQDAPDQLRKVYYTIFTSNEFQQTWGGKVTRPFELVVKVLRAIGAEFSRVPDGLLWTYDTMGQPLFSRHTPDGYPDKAESWINSMVSLYSWNFIIGIVENWANSDDDKVKVIHVDVRAETPEKLRSAEKIVDYWIDRIFGRPLPVESRQALIDFLRESAGQNETLSDDHLEYRLRGMVELALMAPELRQR